jgi:hypothetical protein
MGPLRQKGGIKDEVKVREEEKEQERRKIYKRK